MRLANRIRGLQRRLSGFRGHVDGVIGDTLEGWVQPLKAGQEMLRVGIYVQGARIHETWANVHRGDLEAAGMGHGKYGFSVALNANLVRLAAINGGTVEVRVLLGNQTPLLGRCQLTNALTGEGQPVPSWLTPLQRRLYADVQLLSGILARPTQERSVPPVSSPGQAKLFGRTDYFDPKATLPEQMFGYAEYIRYRDRLDEQFDTAHNEADIAHFYKRYLGVYGAMRGGLRIPLSKQAIDWLNEPVVIPGRRNSLTRAAWGFLMDAPPILHSMNFEAHDWYLWAVYWWSINQAKAIHCEDCLVPQDFVDLLASVPECWRGQSFAPSEFMLRQHEDVPEFATLNLDLEEGRAGLVCALLLMGLSRPDYLRYIPSESLEAALSDRGGLSPLDKFCVDMGQPVYGLNRTTYAKALRLQSFDLDEMRFLTFTAEGHRAEYAQLPPLPGGPKSDIQVIGPFRKASGLGQATRLSSEMLQSAGFDVNPVDFGLDNPAPEGFSRAASVSKYRPAKVNLIHLNAEAIPLVYAYQPDVFTGAYNIGYFFWELDSPGACHFLGMDLLDEIWVSTEYGVTVFQPHTEKPVVNVGMSYEALPEIDRTSARAFLEKSAKIGAEEFVFMVTFDSFSFVQRKNPLGVLEAFQKAFADNPKVRLVIKTQNRTKVADPTQIAIWEKVDTVLERDNRIVLINETLQYGDVLKLKKGSDAYISLHRSEGWGFGMIEAMNLGVPVVATAYSGNMDFCTDDTCWMVDYELTELGPQDYIFVRPGQQWAEPNIEDAARQMRALYENPKERTVRAQAALKKVQAEFSEAAIARRYGKRMHEILAMLRQQAQ